MPLYRDPVSTNDVTLDTNIQHTMRFKIHSLQT